LFGYRDHAGELLAFCSDRSALGNRPAQRGGDARIVAELFSVDRERVVDCAIIGELRVGELVQRAGPDFRQVRGIVLGDGVARRR